MQYNSEEKILLATIVYGRLRSDLTIMRKSRIGDIVSWYDF